MRAYERGRSDALKISAEIIGRGCKDPAVARSECLCDCCVARLRILAELYAPKDDRWGEPVETVIAENKV